MKVINVVGARPNFMKIAPLMEAYKHSSRFDPMRFRRIDFSSSARSGRMRLTNASFPESSKSLILRRIVLEAAYSAELRFFRISVAISSCNGSF